MTALRAVSASRSATHSRTAASRSVHALPICAAPGIFPASCFQLHGPNGETDYFGYSPGEQKDVAQLLEALKRAVAE